MTSKPTTGLSVRFREAEERIFDPETIEAKLGGLDPNQRGVLWRLYRSSRSQLTRAELRTRADMARLFKLTSDDIETDIYKTFSKMGTEEWDYNAVRRIGRDKQLLDQINNRIAALGRRVNGTLQDGLLDQFKNTWVDGAYRLDSLTPYSTDIRFGLLPDREIIAMLSEPWSGARFSDRLGLITSDMAAKVKSEIVRSMMSEESWQKTAQRIRSEMGVTGQKSVWRAEMVARTELAHAQTMANTSLYDENKDVIEGVVWVAHPGACDECKAKHGKPVSEVGYPPQDSHPNCVCDILAVPKAWDDLAKSSDPSFKSPASKASWAEDNSLTSVLQ